jgi:multisubunit Na+/H+ antiporter MnhF subunit
MHVKLKIDDFSSATAALQCSLGRHCRRVLVTCLLYCLSLVRFVMSSLLARFLQQVHPAYFMEFPLWNTAGESGG